MRTLHFIVRLEVDEFWTIAEIQCKVGSALKSDPRTKYDKPKVWRPRGKLGVLLRKLND